MKRYILFAMTNFAVIAVLSIVLRLFGLDKYLAGGSLTSLFIFSLALGMTGSLISLWMSKKVALRSTGARIITSPKNDTEAWLLASVERFANESDIGMPDVAIYPAAEVNAFATGARRNSALVAVSQGLLEKMTRAEVEGVLAHEIAHVANGDMITMGLLQGVLNTFVIFISRVVGQIVDRGGRGGIGYFVTYMVAQFVLGILASMLVKAFSRHREFRADEGGAALAGKANMVAALQRLQSLHEPAVLPKQISAFGISGLGSQTWKKLFMTHPPLEKRIASLQNDM